MRDKINKIVIAVILVLTIISFFKPVFSLFSIGLIIVLAIINSIIEQFEKDKRLNDMEEEIKKLKKDANYTK